jgi:FKBP-type peptidyl-prolyl cis-trans isomerase SlyD
MTEKVSKNDFVELEFTGKVKDGEIFDTNIKADADKIGMKEVFPLIIAVGKQMALKGLDKELEGKEIGKQYSYELTPEEAFGKRDKSMVRMIPLKVFIEQKIMPERGMQLSLDGMLVRVLSVSGGRVLVDFNNPLAGKQVVYSFSIKRKVEDIKEKVDAVQEFFFRRKFVFDIDGKTINFKVPEHAGSFITMFEKQFEDILGMKIKATEVKEEKKDSAEEKKEEQKP